MTVWSWKALHLFMYFSLRVLVFLSLLFLPLILFCLFSLVLIFFHSLYWNNFSFTSLYPFLLTQSTRRHIPEDHNLNCFSPLPPTRKIFHEERARCTTVKIHIPLFQITVSLISELLLNYGKRRCSENLFRN